jgi:hypothetical protein
MDVEDFWLFLERSGRQTSGLVERSQWLEHRLSRVSRTHILDFQIHLDAARRPIDTYAMWGAVDQIMDGSSTDGFWYFQPWLIGQGRYWYEHAVRDPDNLADIPAIRALAGRPRPCDPAPIDMDRHSDDPVEVQRQLPRLTGLFPSQSVVDE